MVKPIDLPPRGYWDDPDNAQWVCDLIQRARPEWNVWRGGRRWNAQHRGHGMLLQHDDVMQLDRLIVEVESPNGGWPYTSREDRS